MKSDFRSLWASLSNDRRLFQTIVAFDASNREVHLAEPPCGLVGFLSVDAEVGAPASVHFHEFIALYEHAA